MDEKEVQKFISQHCDCEVIKPDLPYEQFKVDRCELHEFAARAAKILNNALRNGRLDQVGAGFYLVYKTRAAQELEDFLDEWGLLEQDNKEAPSPKDQR